MPQSRSKYGVKNASRTTATVLIDTHDRGKDFGSQRLDISEYITQITLDSHIAGGGAANITLPGIDHFEDIIAAGDLINIYFDTHRGDDNIYNRGNVRTFFGYVDAVSKSITVSGDGSKLTIYTIMCQDFAKAIRSTEIYNNPFLSHQVGDGKPDIIRDELKQNIGGLTVHAIGMPFEGTPRDIVLQGLMRCIGTGGQCILPQHYSEGLPGSQHNVTFNLNSGSGESFGKELDSLNNLSAFFDPDLIQIFNDVVADPNLTSDGMQEFLSTAEEIGIETQIEFEAKVTDEKPGVKIPYRSYLSNTFFKIGPAIGEEGNTDKTTYGPIDNKLRPVIEKIIIKVAHESQSVSGKFRMTPLVNHLADPSVNEEDVVQPALTIFNLLCFDYMEDVDGYWGDWRWMRYSGNLMGALMDGAHTLINELFFDLRPMPTFDNSLSKDGLNIKTNGAIPMVPAVVLREKPFTNYPHPTSGIMNADTKSSVRIGALMDEDGMPTGLKVIPPEPITKDTKPYDYKKTTTDQLFISTTSPTGPTSTFSESDKGNLTDVFEESSVDIGSLKAEDIPWIGAYDPKIAKLANETDFAILSHVDGGLDAFEEYQGDEFWLTLPIDIANTDLTDEDFEKLTKIQDVISGLSKSEISYLKTLLSKPEGLEKSLVSTSLNQQIVAKQFGTILSLPRPVFRSPDGTRITQEKKIAVTQNVIGTIAPTKSGKDSSFKAFASTMGSGVELDGYYETHAEGSTKSLKNQHILFAPGSDLNSVRKTLKEAKEERWHCLDFMTLYPHDIIVETHNRGDNNLVNIYELTGNLAVPTPEAQRFTLNNIIPVVSPSSVQRFGVRVRAVQTKFMDIMSMGGGSPASGAKKYDWHSGLLIRWNILLDLWSQHNHEYVSATMSLRGMPGLRVGYRVDRPDLNLSFYVDRVSHTWSFPGLLTTQISTSRGQPTMGVTQEVDLQGNKKTVSKVLPYYPPEPNINSNKQQRQKLGKIFKVGETVKGKRKAPPGTYTGTFLHAKVRGRDDAAEKFPVPIQGDSGDNKLGED
tara:strand:- start:24 stop:3128 length:3105 start_codon:yes stop_codon:yes gene_type:complete